MSPPHPRPIRLSFPLIPCYSKYREVLDICSSCSSLLNKGHMVRYIGERWRPDRTPVPPDVELGIGSNNNRAPYPSVYSSRSDGCFPFAPYRLRQFLVKRYR